MPSESQSQREMTYRVGWKKGTIARPPDSPAEGTAASDFLDKETPAARFMRLWFWRKAPALGLRVLQVIAFALPVALFAMFLWMVYELSR